MSITIYGLPLVVGMAFVFMMVRNEMR